MPALLLHLLIMSSVMSVTKIETETAVFSETELKRKRGFRRPNGRFSFGGSACIVPVTGRSVVIVSIMHSTYDLVGLVALKTAVKGTAPT